MMKNILRIQKWMHKMDMHILPLSVLRSFVKSLLPFLEAYFSSLIISMIVDNRLESSKLYFYLLCMVASYILKELLVVVTTYFIDIRSEKIMLKMDKEVHLKALHLDYETLENPESLQMIQRAKEAQNAMGGVDVWFNYTSSYLENIFMVIFSLAVVTDLLLKIQTFTNMSLVSILTSWIGSILIIVSIVVNLVVQAKMNAMSNSAQMELTNINIIFNRQYNYLDKIISRDYDFGKVIRLYNMQDMLKEKLEEKFQNSSKGYTRIFKKTGKILGTSLFLAAILNLVLYLVVLARAFAKLFPVGQIVLYVQSLLKLSDGLGGVGIYHSALITQCECFQTYLEFLELDSMQQQGSIHIEKRADHEYQIEFEDVSFHYPGSGEYALKNVNYTFDLHKKLAVVGPNGAGKTTFIKLLCRLYEPSEGIIKLNDIPINKYSFTEYIKILSVVFQDFQLFAFPLAHNVASSKLYEENKVISTLTKVDIMERISQMKDGLDTYLYKHNHEGVEVSGGEAQKIAIARALYKDGSYVVLDEPTAALDPISEYEIYKNFDDMVKDKTSIYISHRMSSCRFCDHILVFDQGNIIEEGTHDSLLDEHGKYYEMWEAQAMYYR